MVSALGIGVQETLNSLRGKKTGLINYSLGNNLGHTWFGFSNKKEIQKITGQYSSYDNDATRLVQSVLNQDGIPEAIARAKERYGAHRIACYLGSITGGGQQLVSIYREGSVYQGVDRFLVDGMHQCGSLSILIHYVRRKLGLTGPYATIGTACSSSAKVFAAGARAIRSGHCDCAIVLGVESFNESLIHGFRSMGVLSSDPCKPWDRNRNGINLGEAAGVALLERHPNKPENPRLVGYGETSDGYHMTAPHPDGEGVERSMRLALINSKLNPKQIDYINAHGSGTLLNDASEDAAIQRVFGKNVPCSSTKGWTGHTQGASGITEALILLLGMQANLAPASINTKTKDPKLGCNILLDNESLPIRFGLTNSMGFGGNNCTLIFGAPL